MDTPLQTMIRQLNVSLRNMKVYAVDHPSTTRALQKAYEAIIQILNERGELSLGVVENKLLIGESPIEDDNQLVGRLVEELTVRNLRSLTFLKALSIDEFKVFLRCMQQDPERLSKEGGAAQFLEKHGVLNVAANDVKYGKIKDGMEEGAGLEEAIVTAFLMEKMPTGQEKNGAFLSLLTNDPAQIGAMLNNGLLEMKKRGGDGEKFARAANRVVEQVSHFLEKSIEGKEKYRKIMAQIMFTLNLETQAAVYQTRVATPDRPIDHIDSCVMDFDDGEVIRLVCNVYSGGLRSTEFLARMIKRVLPDMARRERLSQGLGHELVKAGMEEGSWEDLKDELFWAVYSADQKADRLASKKPSRPRDLERLQDLGADLARQKRGGQIKGLLSTLVNALHHDSPEIRNLAAANSADFYGFVEQTGRFKEGGLYFIQHLLNRLKREPEDAVRESILSSVVSILRTEISKDRHAFVSRVLLTLSKMGYGERVINSTNPLISAEVGKHLLAVLIGDDQAQSKEAFILLGILKKSMLPFVLLSLEKEEKPEPRKRLMTVLKSMGPDITQEIVGHLTDGRWYVVQNSLDILGEIGRETLDPDLLLSSLYHGDVRVRKLAIKILGKLGKKKKCVRILCELLGERDDEIRLLSLRTLGEVGDISAVPRILPFLQRRKLGWQKSDGFRKTAIEVLGRIGGSDAIHPLTDLLKSKGLFKKEDDEIRKSVLEALGAIGNPTVKLVLQSVIEKEADESVREAALRALARIRSTEEREASAS